jgi:N-acetylmuramoyl-L-alanine amidase
MTRFSTISLFCLSLGLAILALPARAAAQDVKELRLRTVVLDPGHGGRDPGSISPSGKTLEKTICLAVALKLGKLIQDQYPDVNVIYTRKTDVLIALDRRTDIANKNHADLFISIHVNAIKSTTPSGSETFIMGMDQSASNMEVSKRENSVIVYEEDYTTKYAGFDPNNPESYIIFSLMQNAHMEQSLLFASMVQEALGNDPIRVNRGVKQQNLLVLWRTTMPAVLVELGFISNTQDRVVMISDEGQNKLAKALFQAFSRYKQWYDNQHTALTALPEPDSLPHNQVSEQEPERQNQVSPPDTLYRVQILASTKKLPAKSREYKGYTDVQYTTSGKLYKYTTGSFTKFSEAQAYCRQVRQKFPQAFVVAFPQK